MRDEIISPWDIQAQRKSPDGRYSAQFPFGTEIAMGSPTVGELWITDDSGKRHRIAASAAASFVWSHDSTMLAFSVWKKNQNQSLCLYQVEDRTVKEFVEEFRVIQLEKFENGIVRGLDSPIYMTAKIEKNIKDAVGST